MLLLVIVIVLSYGLLWIYMETYYNLNPTYILHDKYRHWKMVKKECPTLPDNKREVLLSFVIVSKGTLTTMTSVLLNILHILL